MLCNIEILKTSLNDLILNMVLRDASASKNCHFKDCYLSKKGGQKIRVWLDPPPLIRAMPERKRFFFIDVFPNLALFSATFVTIVTAAYFFWLHWHHLTNYRCLYANKSILPLLKPPETAPNWPFVYVILTITILIILILHIIHVIHMFILFIPLPLIYWPGAGAGTARLTRSNS